MFVVRVGLLSLIAACGRIGFESHDASVAPGPWSAAEPVVELESPGLDDDPTLTSDMLEIYFNSERLGGVGSGDIWVATRLSTTSPFGLPVNVAELNTVADETTPEVSGDGLTMYFSSDVTVAEDQEIYVSTRATRTTPWTAPVRVVELSSPSNDESPAVARDGTTIYFDSPRFSEPTDVLFVATRADAASSWSMPTAISELDRPGEEENPFPEASGLALWYSVDLGAGFDIFMATRPALGMPWEEPRPVAEVNSLELDTDPWVSDDGHVIFFSSTRGGDREIYTATRQ